MSNFSLFHTTQVLSKEPYDVWSSFSGRRRVTIPSNIERSKHNMCRLSYAHNSKTTDLCIHLCFFFKVQTPK